MNTAVIYDRGSTLRQKDNYSRGDAKREGIAISPVKYSGQNN
jgi:hypothetical protein